MYSISRLLWSCYVVLEESGSRYFNCQPCLARNRKLVAEISQASKRSDSLALDSEIDIFISVRALRMPQLSPLSLLKWGFLAKKCRKARGFQGQRRRLQRKLLPTNLHPIQEVQSKLLSLLYTLFFAWFLPRQSREFRRNRKTLRPLSTWLHISCRKATLWPHNLHFLLSSYFSKSFICSALRSVFSSSVMLLVASSPRYIRQNTYCEFINTINQDLLLFHGINRSPEIEAPVCSQEKSSCL